MYGNISTKPTTSYFCYEFFIFVTALLLVFTGCGKDEGGGGGKATPVTTPTGSNWSIPGSVDTSSASATIPAAAVPGMEAASLDSEVQSWLQANAPAVLSALMNLETATGTTDAALQKSSNDLGTVLQYLPQLFELAKAEIRDELISIWQAIAAEVQKLAKERIRSKVRAFMKRLCRMSKHFANRSRGKGQKAGGSRGLIAEY